MSGALRIVVLGGYGLFGSRISRTLAADDGFDVIVVGRDAAHASRFIQESPLPARARLRAARLDTAAADFAQSLAALRPDVVIDTAGPFQARELKVPRAALACGAHCIDLADGRDYVQRIVALDAEAKRAERLVVSGASSVPGLNAAVIASLAPQFARMLSVQTAISPGNRTPRGLATTRAILGYVGKPWRILQDGEWQSVHGWQSLRRLRLAGGDVRWLARCDVPDLDLLPARWPRLRDCDFRAGLELRRMHFGLWLASWAVRAGLVRSMARYAEPLLRISERWLVAGSDTGVMQVDVGGIDHDEKPLHIRWRMIADNGDGPQIPATAAVVLARKLRDGTLIETGARPCLDLFTLDEFMLALEGFAIREETSVIAR